VVDVVKLDDGFRVALPIGDVLSPKVVLATGGRSLPKSGSDGAGFEIARRLGHTIVATTPALVPLLLEAGEPAMHRELSGVAHDAELTLWTDAAVEIRLRGSVLWTHFGISGPVTLNMSRHWLRATLEQRRASLTLSFCPDQTFDDVERWWTARTGERPHASVVTQLAGLVPASVADALATRLGVPRDTTLAHLSRDAAACRMRSSTGRSLSSANAATTTRKPLPAVSRSTKSIRRRCDRACARGCRSSARCWTWTAGSAGSIFSGPGRARASPPARLAHN
jgi:predicted flavoprotein YhiN